jgi:hypothetical protein
MAPGCSFVKNVLTPVILSPEEETGASAFLVPEVGTTILGFGFAAGFGAALGAGAGWPPPPPRFNGARETSGESLEEPLPKGIGLSALARGMGRLLLGRLLLLKLSMYCPPDRSVCDLPSYETIDHHWITPS